MPSLEDHERRLRSLEGWRTDAAKELRECYEFCTDYRPIIDRMVKADEIADAVADALRKRGAIELTLIQKVAASVMFLFLLVDFVRSFF